jgi:hypothetical protein
VSEDSIARDDVFVKYDAEKQRASLEFSNAYGVDFVKKVERVFDFAEKSIILKDKFTLDVEPQIVERFISVIDHECPVTADGWQNFSCDPFSKLFGIRFPGLENHLVEIAFVDESRLLTAAGGKGVGSNDPLFIQA